MIPELAKLVHDLRHVGHDYPGTYKTFICRRNSEELYLREGGVMDDTVVAVVPNGLSAEGVADWIEIGMPKDQ